MRLSTFLAPLVLVAVTACTGAAAPPPPKAPATTAATVPHDSPECRYEVDHACYAKAEDACAVAGCALEACTMLEVHPAQVRCAK